MRFPIQSARCWIVTAPVGEYQHCVHCLLPVPLGMTGRCLVSWFVRSLTLTPLVLGYLRCICTMPRSCFNKRTIVQTLLYSKIFCFRPELVKRRTHQAKNVLREQMGIIHSPTVSAGQALRNFPEELQEFRDFRGLGFRLLSDRIRFGGCDFHLRV